MKCEEVESRVIDQLEGRLTEAKARDLESHLQRCARCKSIVTRVAELAGEVSLAKSTELSPQFWPRLRQRLEAHDARSGPGGRRLAVWRRRLRPALATACLLMGTWTGIQLGRAFTLRELFPAGNTEGPSELGTSVFDSVIVEALPPGSLSRLLVIDLQDVEQGRSER